MAPRVRGPLLPGRRGSNRTVRMFPLLPAGKRGGMANEGEDTVTVTPCEDGPLLVRGPFRLVTQDGEPIPAGRATVALCRCGLSSTKPFCDGSHKAAGFRAPSEPDPAA